MKPQNVTVRVVEMNDGRRVFGVSFTVSRVFDPPRYPDGAVDEPLLEELVQDQANSIRGDVEAREIAMGEPQTDGNGDIPMYDLVRWTADGKPR